MREITLSSCGAKKFIKAVNSKATMEINNIQYRLIISKLMTFLFLRRSLERFVEESETNCYHFPSNKKKKKKEQEIEERQVQREHSTINVKYPLWNIPVASTAGDEYKTGLYRSKFTALGPPLIPFLFPNSTSPAYGFLLHVLDVYEAFKRPQHNSHNHGQRWRQGEFVRIG